MDEKNDLLIVLDETEGTSERGLLLRTLAKKLNIHYFTNVNAFQAHLKMRKKDDAMSEQEYQDLMRDNEKQNKQFDLIPGDE